MTKPVQLWMQSLGLTIKAEFITPGGKCDLVGMSFKIKNVAHRLRLQQTDSVSSLTRAGLLMRIPEVETGKSLRLDTLTRQYRTLMSEEDVRLHAEKLIAQKFVRRSTTNGLQRLNGWFPLHRRLMAVELKLTRIDQVMRQARNNLHFAEESYVALPSVAAQRVLLKRERWTDFFNQGVGLLSVTPTGCQLLIPSHGRGCVEREPALQFYCVEKFWRSYIKDS